jgi:hypothetical protein
VILASIIALQVGGVVAWLLGFGILNYDRMTRDDAKAGRRERPLQNRSRWLSLAALLLLAGLILFAAGSH